MKSLPLRPILALSIAECRGAGQRLIFFIVCLAIGAGSVMTIKSLSHILETSVLRESKSLLAGDLEIGGSWEMAPQDIEFLKTASPQGTEFLFIKELHAMVQIPILSRSGTPPAPLLVELKAVPTEPPLYPMYGKLINRPEGSLQNMLSGQRDAGPRAADSDGPQLAPGALVEPSFLLKTQLQIGDTFRLGNITVCITGEILAEPDRVSKAFSVGPRVMVSQQTLKASALVRPGSRVRHRTLIRIPDNADLAQTAKLLENGLTDKSVNIRTYKETQSTLTDSIERIGQYLGSIAIIALLMGGIGVGMVVRTFMSQKLDTIAIMKCLGLSSETIFKIYFLQSLFLGLVGSLLGVTLGYGLQYLLLAKLPGLLDISIQPGFYWRPVAQALLLGMAATLLFSLWPLLRSIKTRPLRLFRRMIEDDLPRKWEELKIGALFFLGLSLLVLWQAGNLRRGFIFLSALAASALILSVVSFLALKILRHLPPSRHITRRYGLANLYRPNSQAAPIITTLGMGIMLVLSARLVQMDTVAMLKENTEIKPPNFFFIDIQADQKEQFIATLNRIAPEGELELTPLVRSRLLGVDDRTTDKWEFKNRGEEEWFIHREFILTYSNNPPVKGNKIITGKWWSEDEADKSLVSLEEDAARRLGAGIGSTLVVDIQGIPVSAQVTNIRKVDWRNMRANFYMIFSPGALKGVPITFVGAVRVSPDKETPLREAVAASLPNVTALSTRDIIAALESVTGKLLTLVNFMSAFTIIAGLFILSGAVASTKFRRLKEAAILKTLGADRWVVAGILSYEYAALGIIAGLIGVGLSLALSWAVITYLIKTLWHFRPAPILWSFAIAAILTILMGILSSLDVLRNKPFHTLRKLDG
ncbi:MAG: ABC transporter permease [Nitrospinae bacterium RIFCSPLOWO2_12_FULL_47_7]|nr:MAG: ABC transporter permease [Nitrospinae bacterium RIFCSPLOWO2_12_FULL_47_7]